MYSSSEDDIVQDIISRKEMMIFLKAVDANQKNRRKKCSPGIWNPLDKQITASGFLELYSHQLLTGSYISPHTYIDRLAILSTVGVGKTLAAIAAALEHIPYFRQAVALGKPHIPSVFIVGFSEKTFKVELLKYPELGFISAEEIQEIKKLQTLIYEGKTEERKALTEIYTVINKRFYNHQGNGFFQFIGYKSLVNRIFYGFDSGAYIGDISDYDTLLKLIDEGKIKVNKQALDLFTDSLLICDEIHNSYNGIENNNWGTTLLYILRHMKCKAIFTTATPLNNNATELCDFINLIRTDTIVKKADLFNTDGHLKTGAIEKIKELCRGRISYLRDTNPKIFPKRYIYGEPFDNCKYLRFIRCPMSDAQEHCYNKESQDAKYQDMLYLNDFVAQVGGQCIYKSKSIRSALTSPNDTGLQFVNGKIVGWGLEKENLKAFSSKYYQWITDVLQDVKRKSGKILTFHPAVYITGVMLAQEILNSNGFISESESHNRDTLCFHCGEIRDLHFDISGGTNEFEGSEGSNDAQKPEFEKSGTILVQGCDSALIDQYPDKNIVVRIDQDSDDQIIQTLEDIGFIFTFADDDLLYYYRAALKSVKTGGATKPKVRQVAKIKDHSFTPVRYTILHGEIDKNTLHVSMERYNAYSNRHGEKILVAVGSKIIRESYNFTCVRKLYVIGLPDDISTLKQVFGRGNRARSHLYLPPEEQLIEYRIYVSSFKDPKKRTFEEIRYIKKLEEYDTIQEIEKTLHEVAFDANISYPLMNIEHQDDRQIPKSKLTYDMGDFDVLPYSPEIPQKSIDLSKLKTDTFMAFYAEKELNAVSIIIKRMFLEVSPVWKYDDLWNATQNPSFRVEINTSLIDKEIFTFALFRLTWSRQLSCKDCSNVDVIPSRKSPDQILSMVDPHEKFIYGCGIRVIEYVEPYFLLVSLNPIIRQPQYDVEQVFRTPLCTVSSSRPVIEINKFLTNSNAYYQFEDKRNNFWKKWSMTPLESLEPSICDFGIDFHTRFLEECIEYVFNVWTNQSFKKNYMHNFYFKMLYYYNIRNLVIWAHTAKDFIALRYKKYVIPVSIKIDEKKIKSVIEKDAEYKNVSSSSSGLMNMLKSTLNNTVHKWAPSEMQSRFDSALKKSIAFLDSKKRRYGKIPADMLPVGHFLGKIPRFYTLDDKWFDSAEYMGSGIKYKENPIIIGFDERIGMNTRFKIRPPFSGKVVKVRDLRMIEKGSVCTFGRNKAFLIDVAKKLGVKQTEKCNILSLCDKIRVKLIYNELKERVKGTDIKWFYFNYETQG
jgi:hypothetical protein